MKTKKGLIIGICAVIVVGLTVGLAIWLTRDFDAQGYTKGVLNQMFKGETEGIASFVNDKTEEELEAQYEREIESFVDNYVLTNMEIDEETEEQYVDLWEDIFEAMKYNVLEAEKISGKEYHVPVEYQTVDIYQRFSSIVADENAKINAKKENGEYKGTAEEITAQMQQELLTNCYESLKIACEEMQYDEVQTMVFTVEKNEQDLFVIADSQIQEFIVKIMGLVENQD